MEIDRGRIVEERACPIEGWTACAVRFNRSDCLLHVTEATVSASSIAEVDLVESVITIDQQTLSMSISWAGRAIQLQFPRLETLRELGTQLLNESSKRLAGGDDASEATRYLQQRLEAVELLMVRVS
jgi:hypothetical protein